MELRNEFTVNVPVEEAWSVLTDVERIAPCLPGAELREVEGEEYRGVVKVKVGPITAEYKGTARFLEQDATAHKAVLRAEGRETRGQGNASATITATLAPSGGSTTVAVVTDLTIAGKVAQFGRGVLGDVSNKLMQQFVESLESTVLASRAAAAPAEPAGSAEGAGPIGPAGNGASQGTANAGSGVGAGAAGPQAAEAMAAAPASKGAASVDLLKVVGPSLLKRGLPVLAGAGVLAVAVLRRRARRRG
ncbi:MAG: SRPBCC family protein [Actinomycetota bacterium]|jgi:hypothetical protein|nr:SRPBCC family protein [Actinomycetota bacterium]